MRAIPVSIYPSLESNDMRSSSDTLRRLARLLAGVVCLCLFSVTLMAQEAAKDQAEKAAEPAAEKTEPPAAHSDPAPAAAPAQSATAHGAGDSDHATDPAHTTAGDAHTEHAGGAGHHDPHDLSHQNAGPQIEDPSQWKADLALATFIVFICLLILLGKFAWGPLMKGLEERERKIAANIEEARRSAEMAAAQLRQYEAKLAAATDEAREILNQARRDADAARERILTEAQALAQRERQRAVEDIQAAKNAALQEMTQKSVDLAVSMAGRLVKRQLNPQDHAQLMREMIEKLPSPN